MSRNLQKKEFVEIELDSVDAAKAKILCERKGLPFPSGLSFLVQEVVHLDWKDISVVKDKTVSSLEHTDDRKRATKLPRATNWRGRFGR